MKKKFNFLYDLWDEELNQPMLNGSKFINPNKLEDTYQYVYDTLNFRNDISDVYEIKKCKLSDIKDDETYFYFFGYKSIYFWQVVEDKLPFSDDFINLLKTNRNIKVVFITLHDSDSESGFIKLIKFLRDNKIAENQIYFISNNSKLKEFPIYFKTDINCYNISLLCKSSSSALKKSGGCKFISDKNGKYFLCLNRSYRHHRTSIIIYLKKRNLLKDTNWSYLIKGDEITLDRISEIFNNQEIDELKEEIAFFDSFLCKFNDYEENSFNNLDEFNIKFENNILYSLPEFIKNYENSYVNIITETNFLNNNVIQITEKSLKPFYYFQIPIFVASQNHIKTIKENYGFDFFDDIVNHDYDSVHDNKLRFNKIMKEIQRLYENKETIIDFYIKNHERFKKNKLKVENIIENDNDYNFFKNLV